MRRQKKQKHELIEEVRYDFLSIMNEIYAKENNLQDNISDITHFYRKNLIAIYKNQHSDGASYIELSIKTNNGIVSKNTNIIAFYDDIFKLYRNLPETIYKFERNFLNVVKTTEFTNSKANVVTIDSDEILSILKTKNLYNRIKDDPKKINKLFDQINKTMSWDESFIKHEEDAVIKAFNDVFDPYKLSKGETGPSPMSADLGHKGWYRNETGQ